MKIKEIRDYPNYLIREDGIVISKERKVIAKLVHSKERTVCMRELKSPIRAGYPSVSIRNKFGKKSIAVHRLVAEAFIPNPENKPQVNHKDCNKLNNNVSNLEWVTTSENIRHAYDNGLMVDVRRKKIECIDLGICFRSVKDANIFFNKRVSHISSAAAGERSKALRMKWKYINGTD